MRTLLICITLSAGVTHAQNTATQRTVPRTWDTRALSDWATPLANINVRPGHFSEKDYYKAPADNYRTYPVYLPDREPVGYWDRLRHTKPQPLLDLSSIGPSFNWAAAGKRVWDEIDVTFFRLYDPESIAMARSADYMRKNKDRIVALADGSLAIYRWVITEKGIALGVTACASCHTRVLDDGSTITGPGISRRTSDALLDRMFERLLRISYSGDGPQMSAYRQFGVPWLRDDVHRRLGTMSVEELGRLFDAQIPGVTDRPNGSPWYITKIPDLIGIRDRKYIDHTATHQHRGPGDLMRYAALVEYCDSMEFGRHRMLTGAQRKMRVRWPDEVLYALTQYIYSLQPPPNPNPRGAVATAGERVFVREGCAACHTPPLYTNNKVTLAIGFQPPANHPLGSDIMSVSVRTDPDLALKTRKGTGLYKVPSLKGVWYRGLYSHDGAVANLEDWFDPARLRPDYVPTGFKGVGIDRRSVPGHEFGLKLTSGDKKALIAFLKTL